MYKEKKILAIIPARGGSKGLPGKNIKEIAGLPLIVWTIKNALAADIIDNIVVSTDCEEIAKISIDSGASVPFLRPEELARDSSPSIDAITYTINELAKQGKSYDIVALLEPTSPLRKKEDLNNALSSFIDNYEEHNSVCSVGEIHLESPFITKTIVGNKLQDLVKHENIITQRQDYPLAFFPYGVIYASKIEYVLNNNKVYDSQSMPYLIERWQNYEIDDVFDFLCVESILKLKNKEIL